MDWERLDDVLSRVERAMLALSSGSGLKRPNIEAWRWDEPVITLTWLGADQLKRNIAVRALSEDEVTIEVNAWRDEDRDEGKARVRNWVHLPVRNMKVPNFDAELPEALRGAYATVSGWKRENLKSETFVTTGPI